MPTEPLWWAPFSSPAEFHHYQQEQHRREREAHERWWASLTEQQRAGILQRKEEQETSQRRREEQERRQAQAAEREVADRLRRAQTWIDRSLRLLCNAGAPGTLDVRDEHQQGASLWPRRLGRGWPVGTLSIHHPGSGPSGRRASQGPSTSTFDVLISREGAWLLVRRPQSRPVYVKGRRYGSVLLAETQPLEVLDCGSGRLAEDFRAALPNYAEELQHMVDRLVGNNEAPVRGSS